MSYLIANLPTFTQFFYFIFYLKHSLVGYVHAGWHFSHDFQSNQQLTEMPGKVKRLILAGSLADNRVLGLTFEHRGCWCCTYVRRILVDGRSRRPGANYPGRDPEVGLNSRQ